MLYLKNSNQTLKHCIVIPIVTTLIIPLIILDLWAEIYHRICFPLYKFPYIKRSYYFKFDRHRLQYLNFWQKAFCIYCSYGNGLMNYLVKMAGETERYWCGIQHKKSENFIEPEHHKNFAEYGDKKDFEQKYLNDN